MLSQVKIPGGLGHLLWEVFCMDMGVEFYSERGGTDELVFSGTQYYSWNELVHRKVTFLRVFKASYQAFPFPWGFFSVFNKNNFQHRMCRYRGLPNQVGLEAALV